MQSTEAPCYALSFAAGRRGEHEQQQHALRRHGDARSRRGRAGDIRKGASHIVQVTDDEVGDAIRAYWTDTHNLAEGAGAAPLAAALQEKPKIRGKRVGLILSGGNIDFDLFKRWVVGGSRRRGEQGARVMMADIRQRRHYSRCHRPA